MRERGEKKGHEREGGKYMYMKERIIKQPSYANSPMHTYTYLALTIASAASFTG